MARINNIRNNVEATVSNTYHGMSSLRCSDCGKQIGWQGSHPVGYLVCDACHDEGERAENTPTDTRTKA